MQNRYTGDIGDFGKFLLLKHLFPNAPIATIWYIYPDESHNTDGSHTVDESNIKVYQHCSAIDSAMSELFNAIHCEPSRHVGLFEMYPVLPNAHYFKETVVGDGEYYRQVWLKRAMCFIEQTQSSIVCLDPDNGIEPASMAKLTKSKQGKYATYGEIETFFEIGCVDHVVIYQHFHRQGAHETQMQEAKTKFETLYEGRAVVTIIRHNPVQARFYIILSKYQPPLEQIQSLEHLMYGTRAFFSHL
ncbi:hypothetical protein [Sulfuricurvum sp.]|uniref:hypothetical protein n=1 Tax=Sulfuricurvum sp. TaxID=2025608 RepID=UPI0026297CF2|nr:hypothetical protein [Sulfuricurvum sp.]MDD4950767.1 hypothetical protein [Sulfuricurvum sp.]